MIFHSCTCTVSCTIFSLCEKMVHSARFELATLGFEDRYSSSWATSAYICVLWQVANEIGLRNRFRRLWSTRWGLPWMAEQIQRNWQLSYECMIETRYEIVDSRLHQNKKNPLFYFYCFFYYDEVIRDYREKGNCAKFSCREKIEGLNFLERRYTQEVWKTLQKYSLCSYCLFSSRAVFHRQRLPLLR